MLSRFVTTLWILGLSLVILGHHPDTVLAEGQEAGDGQPEKLQQRIDFGNSYILGQSIKSGAVYLLHRKNSEIKSMLQLRENYREEILENVTFGEPETTAYVSDMPGLQLNE